MTNHSDKSLLVEANWSGAYPNLCSGTWTLIFDGKNVSEMIPKELRTNEMGTFKEYPSWHFENWLDVWDTYEDGLKSDQWINMNKHWLSKITTDEDAWEDIYEAINQHDWRHGSCGGCI